MLSSLEAAFEIMNSWIENSIFISIISKIILDFKYASVLFLIVIGLYLIVQIIYYRKLPPGPWGIPYFGYLPFMDYKEPHSWYMKKASEYGEIYSLKLGKNLVVCVGSVEILKKMFYRPDSIGRAQTPLNRLLGGLGIILSEGTLWKTQRQFLHDAFRNLGIKLWPNQRFEKFVLMEVGEFLQTLEALNGCQVDPTLIVGRHMHNIICQLMMSFRFREDDEAFKIFNERVTRGMMLYGSIHIGEHVNWYMRLPGKQAVLNEMKRNLDEISQFHAVHVESRRTYRTNKLESYVAADLLDHYLEKIHKENKDETHSPTIFPNTDKDNQIVQVMNDLFSAGMETSRNSMLWCVIMMLRERAVAEKVREELSTVVQVGQMVTLEHRTLMPYVEAVIFETLRFVSIVPLGTTHVNTNDWKIDDYIIPAGTLIIPLINQMNVDPKTYPEPYKFKPERFIRERQLHIPNNYMPFGLGQRMCLGTQLARMELFLFFANLMNNYDVSVPEGQQMPGLEGVLGTTIAPLPYEVCFNKLKH